MSTQMRWRLGAVVFVLLAFSLVGGAHLCGVALNQDATDPGMRPIGPGALACTEFWLNRYQTLLGAVAAIIAAYFAWTATRKQIKLGEHQLAVNMMPVIQDRYKLYFDKLATIENFDRAFIDFKKNIATAVLAKKTDEEITKIIIDFTTYNKMNKYIENMTESFSKIIAGQPFLEFDEKTRSSIISTMNSMENILASSLKFATNISVTKYQEGQVMHGEIDLDNISEFHDINKMKLVKADTLLIATLRYNNQLEAAQQVAAQRFGS